MAVSACDRKPPIALPYLSESDVILAFGDSLTFGTGAEHTASYPSILANLSKRTVINAGVPGETTAEGLQRLPSVLDKNNPSLILLCLGGNDFLRKVPAGSTRSNLESMLALIKEAGVPVVLLGVPRPGLGLRADKVYAELADAHGIPLFNDVLSDVLADRDLKSDPVHPNARGYYKIAEHLFRKLSEYGAF